MSAPTENTTSAAGAPVDLGDPGFHTDPYARYEELRARGRLIPVEFPFKGRTAWVIPHYQDARAVLADKRMLNDPSPLFPSGRRGAGNMRLQLLEESGVPREYSRYLVDASILDMDAPDHTRIRKLVSRAFTVKRVNALRPRVEEITDALLDALPGHAEDGAVDLIEHFAYPLPITVICELVGVPEEERSAWRDWGRKLFRLDDQGLRADALIGIAEQSKALIAERRSTPADDLMTALIRAHDEDGGRLSDDELVSLVLTLILAGHETTAHLIGNGTLALLTHPDQLHLLRTEPDIGPRAVHELMRWCGPIHGTRLRYASEDMEVNGLRLTRGHAYIALLGSANSDPAEFPDPRRLDLSREPAGRRESHMGFGHGAHYCLGAALARQEGEVAFTRLFDRYPGLSLAVPPSELRREPLPLSWRLAELPVRTG
ncbi:cytochrome P450 family protein [Nocardiopsis potens]|uniref:cytochrome P450 family protein n=1 Tax=Nocardiopsis potens TaxID=1246458 RepID=UPI0003483FAB|nr:cytochrome P450 [Nocardiopsis potens]